MKINIKRIAQVTSALMLIAIIAALTHIHS